MAIKFDMDQVKASAILAMNELGIDTVAALQKSVPVASGHLRDNIDYTVTEEGDNVILTISLPKYAQYIEWGTPPHMPPVEAIKDWLMIKGLPEELAWPIAISIKQHGTRPQPFIRPYVNNVMISDLKEALKQHFK